MKKTATIDLDEDPAFGFAADRAGVSADAPSLPGGSPARTDDAAQEPPSQPRTRGWLDRLNPFQEQQFARRVTRELVELRRKVEAAHPKLTGTDVFRLVVMLRCKVDPHGAQKLLNEADESFAAWPTARDLNFADVVHLIAIREFQAQSGKARWINANMGQIVATELQRLRA